MPPRKKRTGPGKRKKRARPAGYMKWPRALPAVKRPRARRLPLSRNPAYTGVYRYSLERPRKRFTNPVSPVVVAAPFYHPAYYPPYPAAPQVHLHARRSAAPVAAVARAPGAVSAAGSAYIAGDRFTGSLARDIRRNRVYGI